MGTENETKPTPDQTHGPWHWLRLGGGWLLLIVGAVGFVVPIIPGIPLVLGGLAALSCEYVWARRMHEKVLAWWRELKAKF